MGSTSITRVDARGEFNYAPVNYVPDGVSGGSTSITRVDARGEFDYVPNDLSGRSTSFTRMDARGEFDYAPGSATRCRSTTLNKNGR